MSQQKTWTYEKFERIIKKVELPGLELTTGEVFHFESHCYTIVLQDLHNESR